MPWVEKHRPQKFSDIVGQDFQVEKIKVFIKNYKASRKKAVILHGGPGIGKTTLAHVMARETDSEIFELNASDLRNKGKLQEVLKPALEQQSLIKKNKIILVDEVDGITGADRGGVTQLLALIASTPYPIIITANNVWNKKLSDLRKKCEMISLSEINVQTTIRILKKVLEKEDLIVNENILESIALRTKGDLRAAINDLQSVSRMRDPSVLVIDERNKEKDIFHALKKVFKENPDEETLRIYDAVKMDLDEIFLWVEENIPLEYKGEALEKAYELVSRADVFRGRIYKQQYWRFLVYENFFLSYGIAASKKAPSSNYVSYRKPERILKIWLNNQRTAKKKSISQKYSKLVHIGEKRAMHEFPIIREIIKSSPKIQRELKLDSEELAYLSK